MNFLFTVVDFLGTFFIILMLLEALFLNGKDAGKAETEQHFLIICENCIKKIIYKITFSLFALCYILEQVLNSTPTNKGEIIVISLMSIVIILNIVSIIIYYHDLKGNRAILEERFNLG